MGTLEGPPVNVPESPQYTGPEVTVSDSFLMHIIDVPKTDISVEPQLRICISIS